VKETGIEGIESSACARITLRIRLCHNGFLVPYPDPDSEILDPYTGMDRHKNLIDWSLDHAPYDISE